MRFFILLLFVSLNVATSYSQQRIGLDVGTRFTNLNLTLSYQKVLKRNFLSNVGFFGGGMGESLTINDTLRLYSGKPIRSPYDELNKPITDSITTYQILDYKSRAKALGIQLGIGYFFEFGVVHGIKVNLNSRFGYASTKAGGYYRSTSTFSEVYRKQYVNHFFGTISPELYHTIRVTGRITFVYGVKFPYHYTIDKNKFAPQNPKDLLYGFEPELSIGLTKVIGKCD